MNESTNDNRSPLYFATLSGNPNAVYFLLDKGADIRCVTDGGRTVLMGAAWEGHIALINFFMSRGFQNR